MCKKIIAASLLSVFLLTMSPIQQAWAANTVQVTLPSFNVTLNGQSTGNEYSKYPLIVYKDITYFPMTYYDCRLLGLKTDWTAETGLVIDKNEDYFYEYLREVNNSKNAQKQIAKIADEKIIVNGEVIDNRKEEYPLLVFRDITYFPLTWRFAAEEFGWKYHFDQKDGLVIHNDKVKLENPDDEGWNISPYSEGHCGRGSEVRLTLFTPFPYKYSSTGELEPSKVDFQYLRDNLSYPTQISISNMGNVETFINACMEYHIYRQFGTQEELVYRYLLPPFNGKIEWAGNANYNIENGFWSNPTLRAGAYKICLQTPDYFNCYRFGADTSSRLILHGSDAEVRSMLSTEYYIILTE